LCVVFFCCVLCAPIMTTDAPYDWTASTLRCARCCIAFSRSTGSSSPTSTQHSRRRACGHTWRGASRRPTASASARAPISGNRGRLQVFYLALAKEAMMCSARKSTVAKAEGRDGAGQHRAGGQDKFPPSDGDEPPASAKTQAAYTKEYGCLAGNQEPLASPLHPAARQQDWTAVAYTLGVGQVRFPTMM
jgi:hypothetical protein